MARVSYDLYGIECADIGVARAIVEGALKITLVAHESGYRCGEYFRYKDVGDEHFILQKNYDEFEDEWTEESFSQYPQLLYVNETTRSEELGKFLQSDERVSLLRHQEI